MIKALPDDSPAHELPLNLAPVYGKYPLRNSIPVPRYRQYNQCGWGRIIPFTAFRCSIVATPPHPDGGIAIPVSTTHQPGFNCVKPLVKLPSSLVNL